MRAAVMQNWELRVDEVPDPTPREGQVLTRVLACGICGSDLHMLQHGAELRRLSEELERTAPPDPLRPHAFAPDRPTVMGHEFCCEVVETGPGVDHLAVGDIIVSRPGAVDSRGTHTIGYSNDYPGGYGELVVVNEAAALDVPNGLDPEVAALTEPLAVGIHAVARSGIAAGDAAVVIGLGPVGLACVAELRRRGIGPIVGADLAATRRAFGAELGCDVVVDPREQPAMEAWRSIDGNRPLVVFEAVGVPGMLDQAMRMAPRDSRILVVGVCMQPDRIQPFVGINRELNLQFVLGYTPDEFALALRALAEGATAFPSLVTARVDIDQVPQAFRDLADPEGHAKILVVPAH
ncbi:MAG: zinc-binding dehydrogenase [Acidimicrobiales bacterium]